MWKPSIYNCKGASRFTEFLCAIQENVFLNYLRSKEIFWKKPRSGWKNRFWPSFLVLPVMLLQTQIIEKELFRPFSIVLCSIKNLSELFITTHIVSWHFFCIIKLHFVRTYEADCDFFKKILPSRWFWPVFSRITEYRDIRKQFRWPKKDSKKYCAGYKIFSATTEWMLKLKVFEKKLPFQWKKHLFIFSRNTEFCRRP